MVWCCTEEATYIVEAWWPQAVVLYFCLRTICLIKLIQLGFRASILLCQVEYSMLCLRCK